MNQAQVYSRPQLYIFLVKLSSKESSTVDPHIVCNFGYMRLLFSNSNHNRSVKKPSIVQGLAIQTPTLFYLLVQIAQTFHDVTNAKSYIFTHTHPPLEILFIIDFTLQMQLLKELNSILKGRIFQSPLVSKETLVPSLIFFVSSRDVLNF